MRSAERRKVDVLEINCLRSLVEVSRMDSVWNEEVHQTAGIERELASRTDQRIFRWFGHVKRMDVLVPYDQKGVDGASKWSSGTRDTDVRLDRCGEGGLGHQRNDDGGCVTMRERSKRVESPGTNVTE